MFGGSGNHSLSDDSCWVQNFWLLGSCRHLMGGWVVVVETCKQDRTWHNGLVYHKVSMRRREQDVDYLLEGVKYDNVCVC